MQKRRNWQFYVNFSNLTTAQIPIHMRKFFTLLALLVFSSGLLAQTPAFSLDLSNTNPDAGETVTIDIVVSNFDQLISAEFDVKWNPNVFEYVSTDNLTPDLPGFTASGSIGDVPANTDAGIVKVLWVDFATFAPYSLDDGTVMFTVTLRALQDAESTIEIINGVIIDAGENEITIDSSSEDITVGEGGGNMSNSDPVAITIGNATGMEGQEVTVPVTVSNFTDMESIQFGIDYAPSILRFERIENIGLENLLTGTPQSTPVPTDEGEITVNWSNATPVSLTNGAKVFDIVFTILTANQGNSIVSIEDIIPLEARRAEVGVVDINSVSGTITIEEDNNTGNDGLEISFGSANGEVGQQVCIPVSVQGFSELESIQLEISYNASILNFANFQNFNLEGLSAGNFGTPPDLNEGRITLAWTNTAGSTTTVANGTTIVDICFDLVGNGTASVDVGGSTQVEIIQNGTEINLDTNAGSITATGGIGTSDEFSLNLPTVTAQPNETICLDVTVTGFQDIAGLQYSMSWDPSILRFSEVRNFNPSFTAFGAENVGLSEANMGSIRVQWNDFTAAGVTLNDGAVIYQVCFDAIGTSGQNSLVEFTNSPVNIEVIDLNNGIVEFNQTRGQVNIFGDPLPSDCDANAAPVCMSRETVGIGDNACVRVTAQNFNDLIAMQFSISYNPTLVDFTEIRPSNSPLNLSAEGNFGVNEETGTISVRWDDPTLEGVTLTDDTELFRICFDGLEEGSTTLTYQSTPTAIEVIDANSNEVTFNGGEGSITVEDACAPLVIDVTPTDVDCRGTSTGAIMLNVQGGDGNYAFNWQNDVGSGNSATGLAAGDYAVTVSNDACSFSETRMITIEEPTAELVATAEVTDTVTCFGDGNGAIAIDATGGTGTITYDWTNSLSGANPTAVPAGTYAVTVSDANGCETILQDIVVGGPDAMLDITVNKMDIMCAGENTGVIDLEVAGGTPDYLIRWTDDTTSVSFTRTSLSAGEYQFFIIDGNDCETEQTVVIESMGEPLVISESTVTKVVDNDGSVDISVTGGEGAYTYDWAGPEFTSTDQDIANLSTAGTYTVTITDERGCSVIQDFNVPVPLAFGDPIIQAACGGATTGGIELNIIGGFEPLDYDWNVEGETGVLTGLSSGMVEVTVTDIDGESITTSYEIPNSPAISTTATATPETCSSISNNGAIEIGLSGGTGMLSIDWADDSLTDSISLSNLDSGRYAFTVTDSLGCSIQDTIDVGFNPDMPMPAEYEIIPVTCAGFTDGTISFTIPCGDPGYVVTFMGTDTVRVESNERNPQFTFENLEAGTYTLMIEDGNGNTFPDEVTIAAPDVFNVVPTVTSSTELFAPCNGSVTINEDIGGNGDIQYAWSTGETTRRLGSSCPGEYIVTITDGRGCMQIDTVEITFLNANGIITDAECPEADTTGSVTLNVESGQAPYAFEWRDVDNPDNIISEEQNLMNVDAGTYTVKITEVSGVAITRTFNIGSDSDLEVIPSFGANYNGFGVSCNGATDAMLRAMGRNSESYTYRWEDSEGTELGTGDMLEGLGEGTYIVFATDNEGCTASADIIVTEPDSLELMLDVIDSQCAGANNGEVLAMPSGGIDEMPYSFAWSIDPNLNIATLNGLAPGAYSVTVTDGNDCPVATNFEIIEPSPLDVTVDVEPFDMGIDGTAEATVTGGTPGYTYAWTNLDNIAEPVRTTPSIDKISEETTFQLITTDLQGCRDTMEVPIFNVNLCLSSRAIITPNGDQLNETLEIRCLNVFSDIRLEVYSRWGDLAFQMNDYDGSWTGTDMDGNLLPDGGYFFVLQYNDEGTMKQERGSVTILTE